MFKNQLFTVTAVNGSFLDAADPGTDSLRLYNLTWDEAAELTRLLFLQDFEIVIWQMPGAGEDEQKENAISEKTV